MKAARQKEYGLLKFAMTGEDYRKARVTLDFTQQELADALGVAANTVARRERGELPISREHVLALRWLKLKRITTARKKGLLEQ